jgi:hypothetical protein
MATSELESKLKGLSVSSSPSPQVLDPLLALCEYSVELMYSNREWNEGSGRSELELRRVVDDLAAKPVREGEGEISFADLYQKEFARIRVGLSSLYSGDLECPSPTPRYLRLQFLHLYLVRSLVEELRLIGDIYDSYPLVGIGGVAFCLELYTNTS